MKSYVLLLCLVLLNHAGLRAQLGPQNREIQFAHLSLEQGLSQSSVFGLMQDSQGFMWIGTEDGLNRYDGYRFTTYKHDPANPRSLSSSLIYCVYEDRQGMIWVGTEGGGLNRFDPNTETFTHYLHKPNDPTSLNSNSVYTVYEDRAGTLWVGSFGGGLHKMDRKTGRFTRYAPQPGNPASIGGVYVQSIIEDQKGYLWIGMQDGGLNRLDPKTNTFTRYLHNPNDPNSLGMNAVHQVYEDRQGTIWVATEGKGMDRFDPATRTFRHYRSQPSNPASLSWDNVSSIYEDRAGNLWVGTYNGGLNRFDRKTESFIHYKHQPSNPGSLSNDLVSSILEDRSGVLWVATFSAGVNLVNETTQRFAHYHHIPDDPNSLSHNTVYALLEDRYGELWIGTEGGGLDRLNRKTGVFTHYRHQPGNPKSLGNQVVTSLLEDRQGTIWVGVDSGLDRFDRATGTFTHFTPQPGNPASLVNQYVQDLCEDREGNIWVATDGGLSMLDKQTGRFTNYSHDPANARSLSHNTVYAVYEDRQGNIWAGTDGGGLNRLDRKTGTFVRYQHRPEDPASLGNNYVVAIQEDYAGNLWLGTMSGLNRMDKATGKFTRFGTKDGLPNEVVDGILEDRYHNLWLSTNKGLAKFNPARKTFRAYDVRDGLQSNEFNVWAHFKNQKGEMFFGGINGFNVFTPETIQDNPFQPPVVITDFQIFNQSVPIGQAADSLSRRVVLDKHISRTDHLTLAYDENVFSFEFAGLSYRLSEKNQYAYQMEGFEKNWTHSGTRRFVTYTNLDPGEYTFRVKASNNDGVWNEQGAALRITITPPWWRTWWAYVAYVLLFAGALYAWWSYTINRERLKNDLRLKRLESEKLQEMDQLKTRFFTNISHEFRTPLTLILGPLEKRLAHATAAAEERRDDQMMYRNAQRLLQLINQLLDISKLESGKAKLETVEGNIVQYIKALVYSFTSLAESRGITLNFSTERDSVRALFDKDKLEKIVTNLLSNAFKFTPEEGTISVRVMVPEGNRWIELEVKDTGIGIPADRLPRIFDRFYQVDGSHTREQEGTGIGLALIKELVTLHQGEITVSSELGKGTCFTVRLPIGMEQSATTEVVRISEEAAEAINLPVRRSVLEGEEATTPEEAPQTPYEHLPLILIVEDNEDVRDYIRNNFDFGYRIIEAQDGQAGFERAVETVPDLVISDLMMPRMDGFELCRLLKTDERTSHVPVILLTARASGETRMEGLETGADDYLTKPFSPQELRVRVKNLIEGRKKLRDRFSRQVKLQPKDVALTSADERFLEKAMATVEKNLSDPDFSVEAFESEMAMSKMQLYRKLKALTDQSPNEFIRRMRLKKAAMLISARTGTIAEITYEVGFNNLSYFAKCFKELYGVNPSEYAQQQEKVV